MIFDELFSIVSICVFIEITCKVHQLIFVMTVLNRFAKANLELAFLAQACKEVVRLSQYEA